MGTRTMETTFCDRCRKDFDPHAECDPLTLGNLGFNFLRKGDGRRGAPRMNWDFCSDCTQEFQEFLNN